MKGVTATTTTRNIWICLIPVQELLLASGKVSGTRSGNVLRAVAIILSKGVYLQIAERDRRTLAHVHDIGRGILNKHGHAPELIIDQ